MIKAGVPQGHVYDTWLVMERSKRAGISTPARQIMAEDINAVLDDVRAWLEHPEAGGYRMLKLRLLLDKGYVDLQETMLLWEDRHKG